MSYFYFDAAGDQGFIQHSPTEAMKFGRGSTPYYVQCLVNTGTTENTFLIKQELEKLKTKYELSVTAEFKHAKFKFEHKKPFFLDIAKFNFFAHVTILDKFNTRYTSLQARQLSNLSGPDLTNRLLAQSLAEILTADPSITDFHLVVDVPRAEQNSVSLMRQVIKNFVSQIQPYRSYKVSPSDSKKDVGVQLADMIAGLVMDAYETGEMDKFKVLESRNKLSRKEL